MQKHTSQNEEYACLARLFEKNLFVIEKIKCNFIDWKLTCYTWSKRKDNKSARHSKLGKHHLQELEEENKREQMQEKTLKFTRKELDGSVNKLQRI